MKADGDGHLFWECSFPPHWFIFGRVLSSVVLLTLDKSGWPRCLLWHGWLPALSGSALGDPLAVDAVRIVKYQLETALGS